MMIEDVISELDRLKKEIKSFKTAINEDELRKDIEKIDEKSMNDPNFWNSKESKGLMKEQAVKKRKLEEWHSLIGLMEDVEVLIELHKEGEEGLEKDMDQSVKLLSDKIEDFELKLVLGSERRQQRHHHHKLRGRRNRGERLGGYALPYVYPLRRA